MLRSTTSWAVLVAAPPTSTPSTAARGSCSTPTRSTAPWLFYEKARSRRSGGQRHVQRPLSRLDGKASCAINERIRVYVEGQNLLDTKLRQFIGDRRDFVTNYERLRHTCHAGVSAKW